MSTDDPAIQVACPLDCGFLGGVTEQEWRDATYSMDAQGEVTIRTVPASISEHLARAHPEDPS